MMGLDEAALVQHQEPPLSIMPALNGDGNKAEHLGDDHFTSLMTSLDSIKLDETEKRADVAQTADSDHTLREDKVESPTIQDEGDYPQGVRLFFIVVALVISIFFVGLDMVCPPI